MENFIKWIGLAVEKTILKHVGRLGFTIIAFDYKKPGVGWYHSNANIDVTVNALRSVANYLEKHRDFDAIHPTIH